MRVMMKSVKEDKGGGSEVIIEEERIREGI